VVFSSGAAYLFERNGAAWVESHRFEPPSPASVAHFGFGVAGEDEPVAIGAPYENAFGLADSGSTWLFRRRSASRPWVADQELGAANADAGDLLGRTIVIEGGHVFCAAPEANTTSGVDSGAVAVYDAAEITLTIEPSAPAPGAPIDLDVHRGDPGERFLIVLEDVNGTQVFVPLIADTFGSDHAKAYSATLPDPALGVSVGLRAWKISPTGPIVVSDWAYLDV
jgi:hypothetical protein